MIVARVNEHCDGRYVLVCTIRNSARIAVMSMAVTTCVADTVREPARYLLIPPCVGCAQIARQRRTPRGLKVLSDPRIERDHVEVNHNTSIQSAPSVATRGGR